MNAVINGIAIAGLVSMLVFLRTTMLLALKQNREIKIPAFALIIHFILGVVAPIVAITLAVTNLVGK
jgi:hypothetical protein